MFANISQGLVFLGKKSSVQKVKCPNAQKINSTKEPKCPNVQKAECPNGQMSIRPNVHKT